jgi:hypothetical protein
MNPGSATRRFAGSRSGYASWSGFSVARSWRWRSPKEALAARDALGRAFRIIEKPLIRIARADATVGHLTSMPGFGAAVALTFSSAIENPARFRSSREWRAFRSDAEEVSSGEADVTGRISYPVGRVRCHSVAV